MKVYLFEFSNLKMEYFLKRQQAKNVWKIVGNKLNYMEMLYFYSKSYVSMFTKCSHVDKSLITHTHNNANGRIRNMPKFCSPLSLMNSKNCNNEGMQQ